MIQASGMSDRNRDCLIILLNANHLHPMHFSNILFKYVENIYLLVPATNSSLIVHELKNISIEQWIII